MSETPNTAIAVIGIDIGKNSFHIIGQNQRGGIVLRQKWSRGQMETRLANLPPCLIGMEACVGAHHLSRKLQMLGHDARLMPAKYVRPYSKGQKNDFRDAEAIAEAVQRPTMKFVATKTADQLDLQALHRVRERLVGQRTGVINQIRAFLLERGIAVRQGLRSLRSELPANRSAPPVRKTASAIIIDPDGRFLLQQRDEVPNILYPGMIGLFGGHCEGSETFLECVVREVHEEIGYFIPPEQFEHLLERLVSDPDVEGGIIHRHVFVARDIPSEKLVITEGSLLIVRPDDLGGIEPNLAPSTRLALTALGSLVSE